MKHLLSLAACALVLGACTACAQDSQVDRVQKALAKSLPEIKKEDIHETSAPGIYEINAGAIYAYVTSDGKYLIQGDMMNVETGEEITESRRRGYRLERIAALGADSTIEFSPEKPRHVVTVFTDIDCGYCRKLHSEMKEYNDAGIAIRYVFYPRAGLGSDAYRKAEAVWCSDDRKAALTAAKSGMPLVNARLDCPNPIARDWQLGQDLGLRGTPMMVLPDGEVVNGYVPAQQLAMRLENPPAHDALMRQ
ncbi:DsbC family protein [Solimonas sp. K1W22B-7]|uniref:DsbC family protein n=1 Tax=Solimonas sp. K1W22B-7 TaxID=2303331 RepID=UPI0013C44724|nr:DsbC family protein [Solimonas sp. K1W22B-7]